MKRIRFHLPIIFITIFFIQAEQAHADKSTQKTYDTFEEASKKRGCKSIPYSRQQQQCESEQRSVTKHCKSKDRPISCQSKGFKAAIKNAVNDEERKTLIKARIKNGDHCVESRTAVAKIFTHAAKTLRYEDDKDLQDFIKKLIQGYKAGEPGHDAAIKNFKSAVSKCKIVIKKY
jgi:hypothetical protein